jgi:6-phosphogluconolactonase/glucosamine-6-phosphate isomerase/deaminase
MILFRNVVDTQVHFSAAGHAYGDFFAEEEVRMLAEDFRGIDRIVVGCCDDGHAALLRASIDFSGVVVRLLAEMVEKGRVAPARCGGMNMKVAAHGYKARWRI